MAEVSLAIEQVRAGWADGDQDKNTPVVIVYKKKKKGKKNKGMNSMLNPMNVLNPFNMLR
jgi:hypothetical protein